MQQMLKNNIAELDKMKMLSENKKYYSTYDTFFTHDSNYGKGYIQDKISSKEKILTYQKDLENLYSIISIMDRLQVSQFSGESIQMLINIKQKQNQIQTEINIREHLIERYKENKILQQKIQQEYNIKTLNFAVQNVDTVARSVSYLVTGEDLDIEAKSMITSIQSPIMITIDFGILYYFGYHNILTSGVRLIVQGTDYFSDILKFDSYFAQCMKGTVINTLATLSYIPLGAALVFTFGASECYVQDKIMDIKIQEKDVVAVITNDSHTSPIMSIVEELYLFNKCYIIEIADDKPKEPHTSKSESFVSLSFLENLSLILKAIGYIPAAIAVQANLSEIVIGSKLQIMISLTQLNAFAWSLYDAMDSGGGSVSGSGAIVEDTSSSGNNDDANYFDHISEYARNASNEIFDFCHNVKDNILSYFYDS